LAVATLDDVLARDIDTSQFALFAGACTEADIARFEERSGFALPADFREFSKSFLGGLYLEAREELWPRAKAGDVGPFWSFLYAIKVFGFADGVPDWLDIRVQHDAFRADGAPDLVPFLALEGDADRYCFDAAGQVIRWRHEEPAVREVVDGTFSDVFLREVAELEDRLRDKLRNVRD
jgi:hypothetical protein